MEATWRSSSKHNLRTGSQVGLKTWHKAVNSAQGPETSRPTTLSLLVDLRRAGAGVQLASKAMPPAWGDGRWVWPWCQKYFKISLFTNVTEMRRLFRALVTHWTIRCGVLVTSGCEAGLGVRWDPTMSVIRAHTAGDTATTHTLWEHTTSPTVSSRGFF